MAGSDHRRSVTDIFCYASNNQSVPPMSGFITPPVVGQHSNCVVNPELADHSIVPQTGGATYQFHQQSQQQHPMASSNHSWSIGLVPQPPLSITPSVPVSSLSPYRQPATTPAILCSPWRPLHDCSPRNNSPMKSASSPGRPRPDLQNIHQYGYSNSRTPVSNRNFDASTDITNQQQSTSWSSQRSANTNTAQVSGRPTASSRRKVNSVTMQTVTTHSRITRPASAAFVPGSRPIYSTNQQSIVPTSVVIPQPVMSTGSRTTPQIWKDESLPQPSRGSGSSSVVRPVAVKAASVTPLFDNFVMPSPPRQPGPPVSIVDAEALVMHSRQSVVMESSPSETFSVPSNKQHLPARTSSSQTMQWVCPTTTANKHQQLVSSSHVPASAPVTCAFPGSSLTSVQLSSAAIITASVGKLLEGFHNSASSVGKADVIRSRNSNLFDAAGLQKARMSLTSSAKSTSLPSTLVHTCTISCNPPQSCPSTWTQPPMQQYTQRAPRPPPMMLPSLRNYSVSKSGTSSLSLIQMQHDPPSRVYRATTTSSDHTSPLHLPTSSPQRPPRTPQRRSSAVPSLRKQPSLTSLSGTSPLLSVKLLPGGDNEFLLSSPSPSSTNVRSPGVSPIRSAASLSGRQKLAEKLSGHPAALHQYQPSAPVRQPSTVHWPVNTSEQRSTPSGAGSQWSLWTAAHLPSGQNVTKKQAPQSHSANKMLQLASCSQRLVSPTKLFQSGTSLDFEDYIPVRTVHPMLPSSVDPMIGFDVKPSSELCARPPQQQPLLPEQPPLVSTASIQPRRRLPSTTVKRSHAASADADPRCQLSGKKPSSGDGSSISFSPPRRNGVKRRISWEPPSSSEDCKQQDDVPRPAKFWTDEYVNHTHLQRIMDSCDVDAEEERPVLAKTAAGAKSTRESCSTAGEGKTAELLKELKSVKGRRVKTKLSKQQQCEVHSVQRDFLSDSESKLEKVATKRGREVNWCHQWKRKKYRPFVQRKACNSRDMQHLIRCRECRLSSGRNRQQCRFVAFRRLEMTTEGSIRWCGFASSEDAEAGDIELWLPQTSPSSCPPMDVDTAHYIISNVGSGFCDLIEQEKSALSRVTLNEKIAWKRAVRGVREMCDACSTTLFNVHWTCAKCGHCVCLDCYEALTRCQNCSAGIATSAIGSTVTRCKSCERIAQRCPVNRQPHDAAAMMPTQIIPADALLVVGKMIHNVRRKWRINDGCPCGENAAPEVDDDCLPPPVLDIVPPLPDACSHVSRPEDSNTDDRSEEKQLPTLVAADNDHIDRLPSLTCSESSFSTAASNNGNDDIIIGAVNAAKSVQQKTVFKSLRMSNGQKWTNPAKVTIGHVRKVFVNGSLMPSFMSPTCSLGCGAPHMWLDDGRLLQLLEPDNPGNLALFRRQWSRAAPVIISNCQRNLTPSLWKPETFIDEFGSRRNDLVDCSRNIILIGHEMSCFWEGFECVGKRLKHAGRPMILKLKDWPSTDDFAHLLPKWYDDLLRALPLPEYTDRNGVLNLVSRLPEFFLRPDLGPKMYSAYGSSLTPQTGSTNLHLDISDAVNLMLYVGVPTDEAKIHEEAALEAMNVAGCCPLSKARVASGLKPGALWHIYDPEDSDKIRDLLKKVGDETGNPVEPNHDPIHDQSWYLDESLRARLEREHGVRGYTILQCLGDAVFIPAGAAHQVRNLHSCVKAAEDFVSPENLSFCFRMTQEFRQLSDTHSNHEDKLQVKNIIFHAVKDAVSVLENNDPDLRNFSIASAAATKHNCNTSGPSHSATGPSHSATGVAELQDVKM